MMSRIPPASPAATMLVYRLSNALGCLRMASAMDMPDSTSLRTSLMIAAKVLFSSWPPRISRHCTSGRPASSITENWRVKMETRLRLTLPGRRGMSLISRPFSRMLVTWICCRRSTETAASRVSASSWPSWTWPLRDLPFQTKLGILRLLPLRGERRVQAGGAAVDDLLELVRVRGAGERRFQRDHAFEVQGGQRLVERLHAMLGLAGLHHAVDLVHLVLTDQVADGGAGNEDLHRHRPPLAAGLGQQRLADDPLQHQRKLGPDLPLLVGREDVDDAVDRLRRRVGVQGGEGQVARLGDPEGRLDGF